MFEISELLDTILVVSLIAISIVINIRIVVSLIKEGFFKIKRDEEEG